MNILILGSTGHIGKGLLHFFSNDINNITMFANRPYIFVDKNERFDLIINCVGKSAPNKISELTISDINDYLTIDSECISYCLKNKNCVYIYLSSWICDESLEETHPKYKYWLYKKFIEMKHRLYPKLNIIDLRIPSYFSRWIDLNSGFVISELLKSKKNKNCSNLYFKNDEFMWFYTPESLYKMILYCVNNISLKNNYLLDLWKFTKPVFKSFLFRMFTPKFKLIYSNVKNKYNKKENYLEVETKNPILNFDSEKEILKEYKEWCKLNKIRIDK